MAGLVAATLLWGQPASAAAAPGDFDPTFGSNGVVTGGGALGNRVFVQNDGKIIVVGTTLDGGQPRVRVVRRLANGALDTSYGTGGTFTYDPGTIANGTAAALQPDGRLLVAATVGDPSSVHLLRLTLGGALDPTWGTGGVVQRSRGGDDAVGDAVAVHDGGHVVLGESRAGEGFVVARYQSNGQLDTSFSSGEVLTNLPGNWDSLRGLAIQDDGRIVVGGITADSPTSNSFQTDRFLMRFLVNGMRDTTFGTNGLVQTDQNAENRADREKVDAVAIDYQGRIVAAGVRDVGGVVTRHLPDGSLDPTFSGDGIFETPPIRTAEALGLQEGAIIVGGDWPSPTQIDSQWLVMRLLPNGTRDTAFGPDGYVKLNAGNALDIPVSIAFQADRKIVVAGTSSVHGMTLARLEPPPSLADTAIGSGPSGPTNDATPTFTFSATPPATAFECAVDSGGFAPCTSPHTTAHLAEGEHVFKVRAVGETGPAQRSFTVDVTPPDTILLTEEHRVTNDTTPQWAFASDEANVTFECSFNDAPYTPCESPYQAPELNDAHHFFEVRAIDAAGNVDPTRVFDLVVIDTVAPQTTITAPELTNDPEPEIGFAASERDTTFECGVDGGELEPCTSPFRPQLSDGEHTVEVRATDPAGNEGQPASAQLRVDTRAPNSRFTKRPRKRVKTKRVKFRFAAREEATFACKLDKKRWHACNSPVKLKVRLGRHRFKVRAVDAGGNREAKPAVYRFKRVRRR